MNRVAIITASDTGYLGQRKDLSGPVIQEIVEASGYEVVHYIMLPDDQDMLSEEMKRIADEKLADLIVTTGGTGFSKRDCMPEAKLPSPRGACQEFLKLSVPIACSSQSGRCSAGLLRE